MTDPEPEGHYAKIQINNPIRIIAWSHQSRFDKAVSLIGEPVDTLLDYGCGDGTFLLMAEQRYATALGADADANQIEDCAERLSATHPKISWETVFDLVGPEREDSFDVVVCMETLEHCPDEVVEVVLADLNRLCKPGGRVLISVPIEIGPTFLAKQSVRAFARRRGSANYKEKERYPVRDALRMMFARRRTEFDRPTHGEPPLVEHTHYGFNWRRLRLRVAAHLDIEETMFTPLGSLGGWVSSQAYFVCRPRRSA